MASITRIPLADRPETSFPANLSLRTQGKTIHYLQGLLIMHPLIKCEYGN